MERGPMVAAAILSTAMLAGCQSTTQVKEASGLEGTPTPDEAESVVKTDVSRMRGKWEGRGDTDGARRTLEVDTDAQGNPWFKYCYLAHCRTNKGHTLTHVSITPTKVNFRWNGGAPFTFELDGEILRGKLKFPMRTINFDMRRVAE